MQHWYLRRCFQRPLQPLRHPQPPPPQSLAQPPPNQSRNQKGHPHPPVNRRPTPKPKPCKPHKLNRGPPPPAQPLTFSTPTKSGKPPSPLNPRNLNPKRITHRIAIYPLIMKRGGGFCPAITLVHVAQAVPASTNKSTVRRPVDALL